MEFEDVITQRMNDYEIKNKETWAIYGTGKGGKLVFDYFIKNQLTDSMIAFIDNDDTVEGNKTFCGKEIKKLTDVYSDCDGIIIAAISSHWIIADRIRAFFNDNNIEFNNIIDIFGYHSNNEVKEYLAYIEKSILKQKNCFIPLTDDHVTRNQFDPKIIAWYLPQYHEIESNNRIYGKGFTEWTNTTQTIPMFAGHWQPHIPYDVGYYQLTNTDVFRRQIELAKKYGLYGFSFYYYWFSGEKIMEKPVDMYLEDKSLDFPFCLTWATENWTALWDGGDKEIIFEQKLRDEDDQAVINDLIRYMKDERYICRDGKPLLLVYNVAIFGKKRTERLLDSFRKTARENGFSDLYIMLCNAHGFEENPKEWGADALTEFPPHIICNRVSNIIPMGYSKRL